MFGEIQLPADPKPCGYPKVDRGHKSMSLSPLLFLLLFRKAE